MTAYSFPPDADRVPGSASAANVFLERITHRWQATPSAVFAVYYQDGQEIVATLEIIQARALKFLALLRRSGAAQGDLVLLILRQGLDAHAAFLGAMLGGFVPSFLPFPNARQDHLLFWSQHRRLFDSCGARLAIVFDELGAPVAECADGTGLQVIKQSDVERFGPDPLPRDFADGSAVALLQHSSGTTGLKKGVALSYDSISRQIESYGGSLGLFTGTQPVIATWLPLYHDMGLISSFLLPCFCGIPIISLDPFAWIASPRSLLDAIDRHRATHVWLPNFALLVLAGKVRRPANWDLSSLQAVICCSEPCKPASFDAFLAKFAPMGLRREAILTCYAMAETVFAVSQSAVGSSPRRMTLSSASLAAGIVAGPGSTADGVTLLSNGCPIDGCKVRIEPIAPVGEQDIGEIIVRSDFMFDAYYRNPEATSAAWKDGWYHTGDVGFLDDGELFVVGRIKDIIIVNGRNIFAHDVEAAVSSVAGIKPGRCVAFGAYSDSVGSEQLVVVAERIEPAQPDAELRQAINRAVLTECGIPCSDILIVGPDWLVKTTSGKVSRSENAKRYAQHLA